MGFARQRSDFLFHVSELPEHAPAGAGEGCASSAGAALGVFAISKEGNVLADFGKKLILGLIAAACVVGVHAAMISSMAG
jgi:hypothetical protein